MLRRIRELFNDVFRQADLVLLALCIGTSLFGILMIASATRYMHTSKLVLVQAAALCIGAVLYIVVSQVDLNELAKYWKWIFLVGVVFILLLATPLGIAGDTGNKAWLEFPFLPVKVQPAEIVKLTFIIVLAKQLAWLKENRDLRSISSIVMLAAHFGVIFALYYKISSDMGSALVFLFIFVQVIPIVVSIVQKITVNLSASDYSLPVAAFTSFVDGTNAWLISHLPQLGPDFRVENSIGKFISSVFDLNTIPGLIESVASVFVSIGVAIFSVVFISFFFTKDPMLFRKIVGSMVPDSIESKVIDAIGDIEHLLSRYFVGLLIEVLGVAMLNFLGLWAFARIGFNAAVSIAFITGIMNIIPYVGPLVGTVLGTILATVLKFSAVGVEVHFWAFIALLLAIFIVTQLVDNFLFQPLIYSTSIKASPLEIFIVLLIAGNLAGVFGMLVAIPAYTVARVIAVHFFSNVKAIKRLVGGDKG
mgnify:FL=1